ncbi:MAG: hypothetical protein V5B34_17695 [Accumulibacter sp.]|jgi:hypothetical protein
MTAKRNKESFIRGTAAHRRTESDYMGALLETVTLDDWRDVVAGALQAAKGGDPAARAWLGQYLVGKPETKAPSALTVVVQKWSGGDPVAEKLAKPILDLALDPTLHENDDWKESVKVAIAAELAKKLPLSRTDARPATARESGDSRA